MDPADVEGDIFTRAFHASPAAYAITRLRDGKYIDVNSSLLRILGYSREEVVGHTSKNLDVWVDLQDRDKAFQMVREHGMARDLECRFRTRSGEIRTTLFSAVPLNYDGEVCILSIVLDITERKLAEEERNALLQREQEARARAEEAVRARDQLLSIVSHDLKNPLTAIIGTSQILQKRLAKSSESGKDGIAPLVLRINEAAGKMLTLLEELTDYGRLQAGQPLSLQRRTVDLVALARKAVEDCHPLSSIHTTTFEARESELLGDWDADRLERVLANLLSNAIKYSPHGGEIRVIVGRGEDGRDGKGAWAVLSVSDEGLGISERDLPHVFEWFRRAGEHSGSISGSGIGLASSLQIVQQHGGTITVESAKGQGSTFTVRLPLKREIQD